MRAICFVFSGSNARARAGLCAGACVCGSGLSEWFSRRISGGKVVLGGFGAWCGMSEVEFLVRWWWWMVCEGVEG